VIVDDFCVVALTADGKAAHYDSRRPLVLMSRLVRVLSALALVFVAAVLANEEGRVLARKDGSVEIGSEVQDTLNHDQDLSSTEAFESSSKPNIIFALADDLGWNSMGYENYDLDFATPNMDKMAKKGIKMSNYYAQEGCTPSRASLMTGRYPLTIGMQYDVVTTSVAWGLPSSETTIAEVLQAKGYTTYMVGKWNLGHFHPKYLPSARGFDYFMSYQGGEVYYWSKKDPTNSLFHDLLYGTETCYAGYDGDDLKTYSTFLFRDKAVNVIKHHDYKDPLFLYLAWQAVHDPFHDDGAYTSGVPKDYLPNHIYKKIMKVLHTHTHTCA